MTLEGKIALVTGAGNGIGAATSVALAEAGATVACADIDLEAAERIAARATQVGPQAMALRTDCGDVAQIEAMLDAVVTTHGRLDIIVNNAGVTRHAYIMDITEADWDRMHRLNAKGVFFCLQGAARRMIEAGGGRIINLASVAGRGYIATSNAAYAASKGAVISMTKTAAQQLGRHDINVNAICPGVTLTPMVERLLSDRAEATGASLEEVRAKATRHIPIGRANEPEDIAAMAVFLASPAARNITGQAYNVDGGLVPS